MKQIYVKRQATIYGPYPKEKVLELFHSGFFRRIDTACFQGETEWWPMPDLFKHEGISTAVAVQNASRTNTPYIFVLLFALFFLVTLVVGGLLLFRHKVVRQLKHVPAAVNSPGKVETVEVTTEIKGEITIVGKDGVIARPQGVQVAIFPLAVLKRHLADKSKTAQESLLRLRPEVENAKAELTAADAVPDQKNAETRGRCVLTRQRYQALVREASTFLSASYYFESLPRAAAIGITDANGRFSLHLPGGGDFGLAAGCRGDKTTDVYFWLLAVPGNAVDSVRRINLTSDNHTRIRSRESLIITVN